MVKSQMSLSGVQEKAFLSSFTINNVVNISLMLFQTGSARKNEVILVQFAIPTIFMLRQEPFLFSFRQKTLQGNT